MASDPWVVSQSVAAIALVAVTIPSIIFGVRQLSAAADASKSAAKQAEAGVKQAEAGVEAAKISARQAEAAAAAAKASALGLIAAAGRDMQWRILSDQTLHAVLLPTVGQIGLDEADKRQLVRGMLINYYAFVYEFKKLEQVPDAAWAAFQADMSDFFSQKENRQRWNQVRPLMSKPFQEFIDHEILKLP